MASFFKVGSRYINMDRVHDVTEHPGGLDLVLIGGETVRASGAEATAILAQMARGSAPVSEPQAPTSFFSHREDNLLHAGAEGEAKP